MTEFDLIELIRARCPSGRRDVRLGIGDDCAILAPPAREDLLVTTDTLVEGVHFLAGSDPVALGWKALAVNLSDLAAMGAMPAWTLLSLTLPRADAAFVAGFIDGFCALAAQHEVALVGGDTTSGPLAIGVVVHGFAPAGTALRRDGAKIGDRVFVTGTVGDGLAGLRCLQAGEGATLAEAPAWARAAVTERIERPRPQLAAGRALRGLATACIDTSDGLLADLGHIARRSGVGMEIRAEALPTSSAVAALFEGEERLAIQAGGGDDYQLAFTAPTLRETEVRQALAALDCPVSCIGSVVEGESVRLLAGDGSEIVPEHRGWEHFA
ncbi:MAG: thiamine-phosphate kinase [Xanthomonadales bacterium]|nr:thiamine-phosphate kinase [Xanthomonadales bacterium]